VASVGNTKDSLALVCAASDIRIRFNRDGVCVAVRRVFPPTVDSKGVALILLRDAPITAPAFLVGEIKLFACPFAALFLVNGNVDIVSECKLANRLVKP